MEKRDADYNTTRENSVKQSNSGSTDFDPPKATVTTLSRSKQIELIKFIIKKDKLLHNLCQKHHKNDCHS